MRGDIYAASIHKYTQFYTIVQVKIFFAIPIWNCRPLLCIDRRIYARTASRRASARRRESSICKRSAMAPARVTDKLNTRVNCAALRVFVHIIFWGRSNRRRRSAAFLLLSAGIIRARPRAEVGPAFSCVRYRRGRPM